FSVTEQAIRVGTDGTVVVAVPLYIDPSSTGITSGIVSVILTQGNRSSQPISLSIQNLPTLDTYGTQLGEISHAFLVMETTLLGRRLSHLQAAQLVVGAVDTSAAQATVTSLLKGAILARNDVDRVMLDNSTTIINGVLPSGTSIKFDRNSQDMMDRVLAVYLTHLSEIISSSSTAVS